MKIPRLTELGFCQDCKTWFELVDGALPIHNEKGSEKNCPNSEMSPWGYKYLVKTKKEAQKLATFIENDSEVCLDSTTTGSYIHTLNCGNGENCAKKRLLLAQALAVYYLKRVKQ